jgi:thiamine kinase-like enzyme
LLHRADDALRACGSHERAPTLIHGDLHHSNLIGDKRLYLLDWEYAAVTDPLFDLACLIAYYPRAALHATALLRAAGLERDASLEMLEHATWVYVLLSYLWYRARRLDHAPHASELALEGDLLQRLASV